MDTDCGKDSDHEIPTELDHLGGVDLRLSQPLSKWGWLYEILEHKPSHHPQLTETVLKKRWDQNPQSMYNERKWPASAEIYERYQDAGIDLRLELDAFDASPPSPAGSGTEVYFRCGTHAVSRAYSRDYGCLSGG